MYGNTIIMKLKVYSIRQVVNERPAYELEPLGSRDCYGIIQLLNWFGKLVFRCGIQLAANAYLNVVST